MNHRSNFHTIFTFILCVTLFLSENLPAENNKEDSLFNLSLEELLDVEILSEVASMFPENDLEVGATVAVMTSEEMTKKGVRRIKDALENEISVTQNTTLGGAYTTSIRGYIKKESSGISWLIDGIPVSSPVHTSPNFQNPDWHYGTLSRIEMIKGPGSAIYGSEAFHGVMSLNTFESDTDAFHVTGALAHTSYSDGSMKLSRGFINDRMRVDISAGVSSQDDQDLKYEYRDTIADPVVTGTGERENAYDCKTGVFKIRLFPEERFNVKLSYYNNQFDSEKFPGNFINGMNEHLREQDFSEHDTKMDIYSGSLAYQMANQITIQTSAYYWKSEVNGDYSGFSHDIPGQFVQQRIFSFERNTRKGITITAKQPKNTFNMTWLLAGSLETAETPKSYATLRMVNDGTTIDASSHMPYEDKPRDIKSIYGHMKWSLFNDKAFLLAGGRFDNYNDLGDQFTPRAGIIYKPTPKSAVKALYGNAFNAPASYDIYGSTVGFKGNEDLKAETIDIYELVYLYRDENFRFDLTGFYSHWKDGIVMAPLNDPDYPGFSTIYQNRSKSQAYGMETKLYRKIKAFAFDMGFSWVISEDLDAQDPNDPGKKTDLRYSSFPEYMVLLGLSYTLMPYDIHFYMNNRIYLNRKEYSLAEAPASIGPPDDLSTYYRADLNISKPFKTHYKFDLNIRNLFDRKNRIPSNFGAENGYPEPGISVLGRLSCSF